MASAAAAHEIAGSNSLAATTIWRLVFEEAARLETFCLTI